MKKIIHIGTADKFLIDFEAFNSEHLPNYNHQYFLIGAENACDKNIVTGSSRRIFWKMFTSRRDFDSADQICLHGIFDTLTLLLLILNPQYLKKCNWFIWGGDLHIHERRYYSIKNVLKEILRKLVINKISNYVTYIFKDFEYATNAYNRNAQMKFCILYPSNVNDHINWHTTENLTILLGNSADPRNRHIELIDAISAKLTENMTVILPLSYGDLQYAERIKTYAKEKLKCKLSIIEDILSKDEYYRLLSSVDVACMYHKRQMGMGSTIQLLSSGKRILFASDSEAVVSLEYFGFEVEKLSDDTSFTRQSLSFRNIELANKLFSIEALRSQLNDIYSGE